MKSIIIILLLFSYTTLAADAPKISTSSLNFIENFCMDCHDSETKKGELDLSKISTELNSPRVADEWYRILNSLNAGEMPPPKKKKQPSNAEKAWMLERLSGRMVEARKFLSDSHGEVTIRRMSRDAYANSIYDLLGVKIDVQRLPEDRHEGSYDTYGDSLYFSPSQLLEYKGIASRALERLLEKNFDPVTIKVNPKKIVDTKLKKLTNIAKRHFEKAKAYLEDENPNLKEKQKKYGFENKALAERWFAYRSKYLKFYENFKKANSYNVNAGILSHLEQSIPIDTDGIPSGKYKLTFEAGTTEANNENYLAIFKRDESRVTDLLDIQKVSNSLKDFQKFSVLIEITPKVKNILINPAASSLRGFKGFRGRFHSSVEKNKKFPENSLWLKNVILKGPLKDSSNRAKKEIFFDKEESQSESDHTNKIIRSFYKRASRGKDIPEELNQQLISLYQAQKASGKDLKHALVEPLSIILSLPDFLYTIEASDKMPLQKKLNDYEVATRLSLFLWNSVPDKELLDLAEKNLLSKEDILNQQIDRMIQDERSEQFIESFCSQWLHLERLDLFKFEARYHGYFEYLAKRSAKEEVYRTFRTVLNEGLSVDKLLVADFLVIDEVLAEHYGIKKFPGSGFQKISVPENSPRGGLLTMAATLAMGSDGVTASPVERGAWILRKLLNSPPAPAPADVPALSNTTKGLSKREVLLKHTQEPQCHQCHAKIDPLGLALEDFDASGKLRDPVKKKGRKTIEINSKNIETKKYPFTDFQSMRRYVHTQKMPFIEGFIEQLASYALGREMSFSDDSLLKQLQQKSSKHGYKISAIIKAIITSKAFRHK